MSNKSQSSDEVVKLQQRLSLLREEYVKLQTRLAEVERDRALLAASSTSDRKNNEASFVAQILSSVAGLVNDKRYSDVTIQLENEEVPGHKFVLAARNTSWDKVNLEHNNSLDWSDIPNSVGQTLLHWIYTDRVVLQGKEDAFTLTLMRCANRFQLPDLLHACERALVTSVRVHNCIRYYTTAEEIGADGLKNHCSQLISTHWDDFTSQDFEHMTAPLLYSMFKTKTKYPLHAAIKLKREDVVFLYLIEFGQILDVKLNETDDRGLLPLDIALSTNQEELAQTLVEHKVNVDQVDHQGASLLHVAIARDDAFSAMFLLKNGARVNVTRPSDLNTPLHLSAEHNDLVDVAEKLVGLGADVNPTNTDDCTPLHVAVLNANVPVFDLLLTKGASLEAKSSEGLPPLWFALQSNTDDLGPSSFAAKLVSKGACSSTVCDNDSNTLLHLCIMEEMEAAASFLVTSGASVDQTNRRGETPLHLASTKGLDGLTTALLDHGADPNAQTIFQSSQQDSSAAVRQTPLHLAIKYKQTNVINALLSADNPKKYNFNLKNSSGQTPLGLALSQELPDIATQLLKAGASVNVTDVNGLTLLHSAIMDGNTEAALFLLNNGADVNLRTSSNETCLELALKSQMASAVESLCRLGADLSASSGSDPPLWIALDTQQELASILVRHGADTDFWSEGPDGCQQTLLHRAIDENRDDVACFLIRCGCDLNSPRKPGPGGTGGDEAHDLAAPLHLCCQWGLEAVVQTLLEHGAAINGKDVEGKTPLHCAIENGHQPIINLLLEQPGLDLKHRDKSGLSPFAAAMTFRNNKAAQKILQLEPQAAEQHDSRGRNFLHTAIIKGDLESVLFLLSISVNVHSRTQDQHSLTPLLLAVQKGHAMMVRNLLLAGASVHDTTPSKQTALQLAAEADLAEVCSILLAEGVDYAAVDSRGNGALHLAVKEGHLDVVRVLLTESQIDAEAVNAKGRNPLHILANFAKDSAVAIFDLFLECMPEYPIDRVDGDGNTALLLAYMKGHGAMCRSLVKAGATLGTLNHQGVSMFNCQVATKQLLCRLLDSLSQEPKWGEGDVCEECTAKFGITTRRHHCRHCGRLLCNKCSDKHMPILKYNLTKPVRVCDICSDVLTVGPVLS